MDPNLTPALPPPLGVEPFVDPANQLPSIIAGSIVILVTVTSFVAVKVFTKAYVVREFNLDDYVLVLAWALLIVYGVMLMNLGTWGFGKHLWDINFPTFSLFAYNLNVLYIVYAPTTAAAKFSVLYQIGRIFKTGTKDAVFYVVRISIALNMMFYLSYFFVSVFQCWPREAIWNPAVKGVCINSLAGDLATGIINVTSDLEALLLPAWAIWHLRLPIKKRVSIFAVFGVGALAVTTGAVGVWLRVLVLNDPDFTWIGTYLGILIVAEIGIVNIVNCMTCLPRFWRFCANNFNRNLTAKELSGNKSGGAQYSIARSIFKKRVKLDPDSDLLATDTRGFTRFDEEEDIEIRPLSVPERTHTQMQVGRGM